MPKEFDKKLIHITQLLLDPENPRHDVIKDQPEIIEQLLETEQIIPLAKDIAQEGSLSPLEIIGVIKSKESDDYIVVEGNRRVCACLLLHNPELSSTDQIKKKLKTLTKSRSIPDKIECIVFDSRDSADHWIQLRHEGLQGGIGTKQWDATQIGRYSTKRGRSSNNIQAIKLLDFSINKNIIENKNRNSYSVTTLQRYLNNPIVRNTFGLEDRENLITKHDEDTFINLTQRFLEDADKGVVNSRSKQKDWKEYANTLQREVSPPPNSKNQSTDLLKNKKAKPKPITRSKQDPSKRKFLIPSEVNFTIDDSILNRVYKEIKRLEVEKHEFSTAFLLRAFIEASALLYLKKHLPDEAEKDSKLHKKLILVSEDLKNNKGVRPQKLSSLNIATSDKNSLLSPLAIGSMVHLSVIPTKRELLAIWDRLQEVLLLIHKEIN